MTKSPTAAISGVRATSAGRSTLLVYMDFELIKNTTSSKASADHLKEKNVR